ncbi:hypothetical protein K435DRAFT_83673 [Dendrothele bispora CBS 962.96]|uniref:Uncharacterized protein n=1 Tax=Dendrothele bispora (strain CBS 962.96) TaxID=1314807 RepID=A0A4S8M3S1_DENBC|nr:hypothetical protein K435DRAFT_83673 [Dendrothele bispora CBS 962.96]
MFGRIQAWCYGPLPCLTLSCIHGLICIILFWNAHLTSPPNINSSVEAVFPPRKPVSGCLYLLSTSSSKSSPILPK